MAVTGHATAKEVQRYTQVRHQKRLASDAMAKIGGPETEQSLANPSIGLAKPVAKHQNNKR